MGYANPEKDACAWSLELLAQLQVGNVHPKCRRNVNRPTVSVCGM
jgi:hypothetical protein